MQHFSGDQHFAKVASWSPDRLIYHALTAAQPTCKQH